MLKLATKFKPRRPAFEDACRAGFCWAEMWLGPDVLAGWQGLVPLARSYPLGYALHFPNRLDLAPECLEQVIGLYRGLGCRCLVLHEPMRDRYAAELLRLEPGLGLAVENHDLTPGQLDRWVADNPGLALDVEHLWKYTLRDAPLPRLLEEVRRLLDVAGERLLHVHLPGYLPGQAEHRPMDCAREMVFPVLSLLWEAGFGGLVVSEAATPYQNPADLRRDVFLFEAWRARQEATPPPARCRGADAGVAAAPIGSLSLGLDARPGG